MWSSSAEKLHLALDSTAREALSSFLLPRADAVSMAEPLGAPHGIMALWLISTIAAVVLAVGLTPASSAEPSSAQSMPEPKRLSHLRIWALCSTNLGYGYGAALQGVLLLAKDVEILFPDQSGLALAGLASAFGVCQLVGPVSGKWSDEWRSRLGRRRPLLLISVAVVVTCVFGLWTCVIARWRWLYCCIFVVQQLAFNVFVSVQVALVPDLVHAEQQGFAGGAAALNLLAGAVGAFSCVIYLKFEDHTWHYGGVAIVCAVCCVFVLIAADEPSSLDLHIGSSGGMMKHIEESFAFDFFKHRNFSLVLLSKTGCYTVMTLKGFLRLAVQDLLDVRLEEQGSGGGGGQGGMTDATVVSLLAIISECVAALVAFASMWCFDGGNGPRRGRAALITGTTMMAVAWLGPLAGLWGYTEKQALSDRFMHMMYAGCTIWGVGQGLYYAGDYVLSFSLVPDRDRPARALGLNSVCSVAGALFGGAAAGSVLALFGRQHLEGQQYGFWAYAAIFWIAVATNLSQAAIGYCIDLKAASPPHV